MARLTAKYDLNLKKGQFLINRPQTENLVFKSRIDDFDVELYLCRDTRRGAASVEGNEYWPTSKIRIVVGRNEDIEPPLPKLVNGKRRFEGLLPYYDERLSAYREAALGAANRAILFFKYKLHNPNLSMLSKRDILTPSWSVDGGEEFSPIIEGHSPLYNHNPGFGIEHLSPQHDSDLENALQIPIDPELSEELMSDAQSAVLQNNLRRSVLEMAIACEIAVKQGFLQKRHQLERHMSISKIKAGSMHLSLN